MGAPAITGTATDERGTGVLGAALGVAIVVALLGLAGDVAVALWTRSTIEAAAEDAAVAIATTHPSTARAPAATAIVDEARARLGSAGRGVRLEVESLAPDVVLRVRAPGVILLPRMVTDRAAVGAVDRRIVVRAEADRP